MVRRYANLCRLGWLLLVRACVAGGEGSEDQGASQIEWWFGVDVFYFVLPVFPKIIKPQAVGCGVNQVAQGVFQREPLGSIDFDFKYGILHELAVVLAGAGYLAQAALAGRGCGADVVADEYQHGERDFVWLCFENA